MFDKKIESQMETLDDKNKKLLSKLVQISIGHKPRVVPNVTNNGIKSRPDLIIPGVHY